jgi:N-acetylneuraminate lyase
MQATHPLHGLVAATHTPFHSDFSLDLSAIEQQAAHLLKTGVKAVFVCGTTGESSSLTVVERRAVAARWSEVVAGTPLRLIVHVGSNCLGDSQALAAHAREIGAGAIAALAPSYFKPRSIDTLVSWCAEIAAAAPGIPFYYYDIPSMTGVSLPTREFLEKGADRIPTLVGLKFTNPDLMTYLQCLQADGGRWDIPWGLDEWLLAALATGARGAVGSSFNFAAPIYTRLIAAFDRGDFSLARTEQHRSTQLITLLARYGYMAAAKATMGMLGVEVGPPRLPNAAICTDQISKLRAELESLGFFDWLK